MNLKGNASDRLYQDQFHVRCQALLAAGPAHALTEEMMRYQALYEAYAM
jgi:hypothetical protein